MSVVPLAADERLSAAFARYDAAWLKQGNELAAARLEVCEALLACGEMLAPVVLTQMALDRAAVREQAVIHA